MEKKVLNELLTMDKKELKTFVEKQGKGIDLGIYLASIWSYIDTLCWSNTGIVQPVLNIAKVFRQNKWAINDYLDKRREYKYFEEKDIDERKKIIISDYIGRINPSLKTIGYYETFSEQEQALKIYVRLEDNKMIRIDMIDLSRHIEEILENINKIEIETFKIYQFLH